MLSLCSALATAESSSFSIVVGRVALAELQDLVGVVDASPRMRSSTSRTLYGETRQVADRARAPGRSLVLVVERHQRRPDRSWPAWNRNVRVGANSPSL